MFKHTSAHTAPKDPFSYALPARSHGFAIKFADYIAPASTFTLFARRELLQRAIIKPNARRVNKIFFDAAIISGWILSTLKTVICMLCLCVASLYRMSESIISNKRKKEVNLLPT